MSIIDDDPEVRWSIQALPKAAGLLSEAFGTAEEFLCNQEPEGPSCLVLDVSLPGVDGLELQRKVADGGVHIPIIFITGHGDIPMTVKAIKSGAVEFLTKPFIDQDLLNAIQLAFDRDRAMRQLRGEPAELRKRYESLTVRERQVMGLVVSGMLNKQVAFELGTSAYQRRHSPDYSDRFRTRQNSTHARGRRLGDRGTGWSSRTTWLEAHYVDLQDAASQNFSTDSR
jgi:FixJ family two-component response regulator